MKNKENTWPVNFLKSSAVDKNTHFNKDYEQRRNIYGK